MNDTEATVNDEFDEHTEARGAATSAPDTDSTNLQPFVATLELDRNVNFALQQNDVRVVKTVVLTNNTERVLRDVELRIEATPNSPCLLSAP